MKAQRKARRRRSNVRLRRAYVYFLRMDRVISSTPAEHEEADRHVIIKIGISTNMPLRMQTIQDAVPAPLELLGVKPFPDMITARAHEKDLHARFHNLRFHREWFRESPELIDHVRRNTRPYLSHLAVAQPRRPGLDGFATNRYLPTPPATEARIMDSRELAEYLGISYQALARRARRGDFPYYRFSERGPRRFRLEEVLLVMHPDLDIEDIRSRFPETLIPA